MSHIAHLQVNGGQRKEMSRLNLVAARHRKREMVGRVSAVEEVRGVGLV